MISLIGIFIFPSILVGYVSLTLFFQTGSRVLSCWRMHACSPYWAGRNILGHISIHSVITAPPLSGIRRSLEVWGKPKFVFLDFPAFVCTILYALSSITSPGGTCAHQYTSVFLEDSVPFSPHITAFQNTFLIHVLGHSLMQSLFWRRTVFVFFCPHIYHHLFFKCFNPLKVFLHIQSDYLRCFPSGQ